MPITVEKFANDLVDHLVTRGVSDIDCISHYFIIKATEEKLLLKRFHSTYERSGTGYYMYRVWSPRAEDDNRVFKTLVVRNARDVDCAIWILHRVAPTVYPETYDQWEREGFLCVDLKSNSVPTAEPTSTSATETSTKTLSALDAGRS